MRGISAAGTTQAIFWDRGRPRPQSIVRLNVRIESIERFVRASRSLAGEGARGPNTSLESVEKGSGQTELVEGICQQLLQPLPAAAADL